MAEQVGTQPAKQNPFVKFFLPGLVIGLVVGGFAGAVLPPIFEAMGNNEVIREPNVNRPPVPRDDRPVPPVEPAPTAPETIPTAPPVPDPEAKPNLKPEPRPIETQPVTPPTPAPK